MTPVPVTSTPIGITPTVQTTPTPTPTPGTTPTPTPTPGSSTCKVVYAIQNQWTSGFTANVTITNTGSSTLNSWTLVFTFPDTSQKVSQGWSATWSQSGQQVTVVNASWNGSLTASASTSIGFNGTFSSANPVPTSFMLNGVNCARG